MGLYWNAAGHRYVAREIFNYLKKTILVDKMFDKLLKKTTIGKVMLLLAILYVIPTFINYDFNTENRFIGAKISLPYLYAGDQIHYYILVYSLLKDGDFDVKNNYDNSEFNMTYDIGYLFRGQHLFREAGYFNFKTRDYKPAWVENTSENINLYGEGKFFEGTQIFETPNPGKDYGMLMIKPLGLPLFYYILLLPFNFVPNPEPLVIFLTVFLTLAGIYLFFLTLNHFLKNEKISAFFTLLLGTSSELWHYSKLFYPDVIQFFLLIFIIYLFIVKRKNVIVGLLFAIGIFMKPTFAAFLPFFVAYHFFRLERYSSFSEVDWSIRRSISPGVVKRLTLLLFPVILAILAQMYQNYYIFGGIFSNPHWESLALKDPLSGLLASFFRIDKGLLIFSPILLFAFFGIKSFYNKHKINSIFIYLIMLASIFFYSSTLILWKGLDSYSFRYYVPIIPYFYIPLAFWYKGVTCDKRAKEKNKVWLIFFYLAAIVSIIINLQAAIFHTLIWGGPPWKIINLLIEHWRNI